MEIAQIVVQERYRKAQRPDQGPEDPEVIRDKDLLPLGIEIEELGTEDCLKLTSASLIMSKGDLHTAIVARGRKAIVTHAMALMDLLSFFMMRLSC